MTFFALSVLVYGGLTAWLTRQVAGTPAEWGYTLGHLFVAAAINAHLLAVARRRDLAFLGSAPLVFLVVHHVYFTISGLKYFSPILLFPQFELELGAQFAGSVAGAVVLFLCALLLRRQRAPTSQASREWMERHWAHVRRLLVVSAVGSLACKAALVSLGYGSIYTGSEFHEHEVRSYADYFLLLGNDTFGTISLVLGLVYLFHRRASGPARPLIMLLALAGVLLHVGYVLLFLKARMILLVASIVFALAAEIASRRRAERLLQGVLLVLPALSLLGVQLTLLIGRFNVPEDTGLRLAIAAVNRRADLTDFATAMVVQSGGSAFDPTIVSAAVLNAIPRAVFPGKDEFVDDVYTDLLQRELGWPAGFGEDLEVDYLDTVFSNGVMALGAAGFVLVPLALVWALGGLVRWVGRRLRGVTYGLALLGLWLSAMHIEGEWASIPLNFRQALFIAVICAGVVALARDLRHVLVIASRPTPAGSGS